MRLAEVLAVQQVASNVAVIREVIGRLGLNVDMQQAIELCTGEHAAKTGRTVLQANNMIDIVTSPRPPITTAVIDRTRP